ncbi:MAG: N-acetylornithine carbamoyltransferase [Pseudobacteriovorax sp.]|nr:N-acetylornithine carbamoyltransferase [Pseudobacteriovorax sp.]
MNSNLPHFTDSKSFSLDDLVARTHNFHESPYSMETLGHRKTLGLLFFNPSLRTRISTQKAAQNLGLNVMVMNFNDEGWQLEYEDGVIMDGGTSEHIKEAASVLGSYCDIVGVRSFAKLKDQESDSAETVLQGFINHAGVPIVSLESCLRHPLQSLADISLIKAYETKSNPKIVLTWAPHVKPLPQAVANSFAEWCTTAGYEITIANPEGYDLDPQFTQGHKITHNQNQALEGADYVYAKNWSSLSPYGSVSSMFSDWTITKNKLELTSEGKFMHCLPVRRNLVVSDEVLDSRQSLVQEQAKMREYAAQAVLSKILEQSL